MKNIIAISIIVGLLLPSFSFAQTIPETTEEAKALGEKMLQEGEKQMPGLIEKMWNEEVFPIWQKMWRWLVSQINSRIVSWLHPEVEKRKEIFEENFPEEKEKMKEEAKTEAYSLWQKFKDLIK
ncbi:MAG: hypothetical protein A2Z68_01695 [Candidatus Nealsonbacteria bacterium RBG_13_38_11]|uniref:Uncharacterized protein n=1 Tax=Candidatus Nealsonbacteria bacterium RBG_13_38_11 TaxID=1801662 RepID=A0A1G2DZT8_9BACT|nr:MAG: hypothetical protein A2Z68_01695 [Candidatus Nealsonbacteria bacterium RBG_13_38_11]